MPSTLREQWPLVPVEFPRAGEGVGGHTRWFSKRLSNCKRGLQLLRGHALQALGSLPRMCARGVGYLLVGPGKTHPSLGPLAAEAPLNALWGPDL